MVQLRDPDAGDDEFVELGRAVAAVLRGTGVPLIVNDRVHLVRSIGADGAHIGQGDLDPIAARAIIGPDALLGLSVQTPAHVGAADALPPRRHRLSRGRPGVGADHQAGCRRTGGPARLGGHRRRAVAGPAWRSAASTPRGRRWCATRARPGSRWSAPSAGSRMSALPPGCSGSAWDSEACPELSAAQVTARRRPANGNATSTATANEVSDADNQGWSRVCSQLPGARPRHPTSRGSRPD